MLDTHLRDPLRMVTEAGNPVAISVALLFLVLIECPTTNYERAARMIGRVERLMDNMGGGPSLAAIIAPCGDLEGDTRRALGEVAYERARAEGQGWLRCVPPSAAADS